MNKTIVSVPSLAYGFFALSFETCSTPSSNYYTTIRSDDSTSRTVSPPKSIDLILRLKDNEASEWDNETTDDVSYKWGVYPVRLSIASQSCRYTAIPIIVDNLDCDIELPYKVICKVASEGRYKTATYMGTSKRATTVVSIENNSIISSVLPVSGGKLMFHVKQTGITKVDFSVRYTTAPTSAEWIKIASAGHLQKSEISVGTTYTYQFRFQVQMQS